VFWRGSVLVHYGERLVEKKKKVGKEAVVRFCQGGKKVTSTGKREKGRVVASLKKRTGFIS